MSRPVTEVLLHHIQRLARDEADARKSDAELLCHFCATGHGEAFTLLVQRHGALVWRVCTAALPCRQDAEDVFQATFLVLARKARSIRKPGALVCWLHGVADRLARKVRSQNARRAQTGAALDHMPARALDDWTWREVRRVMHEELARLPEKLRLPILLCHLEEQTQEEAAQALGWTAGQLRGRLLRGRALLQRRLSRRGLAPAVPLFPALLVAGEVSAAPPLPLVAALRAGVANFAAGGTPVSATDVPLRLAQQFSRQATFVKGWVAACCALVMLLTGVFGVLALHPAAPMIEAEAQPPAGVVPALAGWDEPVKAGATQENKAGENGQLLKDELGDPLPAEALLRLGTLRFRHNRPITLLAFDAAGKELLCGGWGRTVRRWDADTGKELPSLTTPDKSIDALTLTPDGKTLITGKGGVVRVWDVATRKEVKQFTVPGVEYFRQVAASGDGRTLAVAGQDKAVRLWDWTAGKELRTLHTYPNETTSLAFSPNGKLLASAAYDKTARIHEVETGTEILTLQAKKESFRALAFSPDGKTLLTGEEMSACVWDAKTGQLLYRKDWVKGSALVVRFAPDGRQFAAGTSSGVIYLWDTATGKNLQAISAHTDNVQALAFSPDGKKLASGGSESSVRLWDTGTGKQLNPLVGHQERITAIAVAPDGNTVATVAWDQTICLWDARTGKELRRLTWPPLKDLSTTITTMMRDVAFSPDGKWLAAAGNEHKVWLWDLTKEQPVRSLTGTSVAFSPDGKYFAAAGWNTKVGLFELATGKEIREFKGHISSVHWVRFTPDGKSLVTASDGAPLGMTFAGEVWDKQSIWVWDLATAKARVKFGGERSRGGLALSPDGRTLAASGFFGKSVALWELATGHERAKLESGHEEYISGIAFSPDGKLLATASMDHTSCLWQLPSGKKLHCFHGHRSWVLTAAFFPDGKKLLTAGLDTTGLIWQVPALPVVPAQPLLKAATLTRLWDDLGGEAWDAYRAMNSFVAAADQAVPFLTQKVKPAAVPDPVQVAQLIADLDSKTFAVRQHAMSELEKMSELVAPQLQKALAKPASVEMALRLKKILDAIGGQLPGSETVRGLRAIEILEYIGTPQARSLLQSLSQGAPGAVLTREARATLKRLKK